MQNSEILTTAFCGRRRNITKIPRKILNPQSGSLVNRWVIYKQLCVAKSTFGLNDRCLAVLSALLSFYPEDELSATKGLVVFPSNKQLSLRAHGMPESTLRRHLASLIDAGIIFRKDSPTRKRYAHKDREGAIELAYGFSVAPLIERADEITQAAEKIITDIKTLKRLRDEVSVIRRDIAATFADLASENCNDSVTALFRQFRGIVDGIPRRASINDLATVKAQFDAIRAALDKFLNYNVFVPEMSGNDAQIERHHNESLPESHFKNNQYSKNDFLISEPFSESKKTKRLSVPPIPLDIVLRACPDVHFYAPSAIKSWRDMFNVSRQVSKYLGIGQQLYHEASEMLGSENLSAVIAWLLQKNTDITSPGGYLRSLMQKARGGDFSVSALLMGNLKIRSLES